VVACLNRKTAAATKNSKILLLRFVMVLPTSDGVKRRKVALCLTEYHDMGMHGGVDV